MTGPPPKPEETEVRDPRPCQMQTLQGRAQAFRAAVQPRSLLSTCSVRQWAEPPSPHHQPGVLQTPLYSFKPHPETGYMTIQGALLVRGLNEAGKLVLL